VSQLERSPSPSLLQLPSPEHRGPAHAGRTCAERTAGELVTEIPLLPTATPCRSAPCTVDRGGQLPSPEHRGPAHAGRTCAERTAGVLVAEILFYLTTSTYGYALSLGFVLRGMVYVVVLQVLLRPQESSCAPSLSPPHLGDVTPSAPPPTKLFPCVFAWLLNTSTSGLRRARNTDASTGASTSIRTSRSQLHRCSPIGHTGWALGF
jgi:hypothetical protein